VLSAGDSDRAALLGVRGADMVLMPFGDAADHAADRLADLLRG
jgi:hypothetical protein